MTTTHRPTWTMADLATLAPTATVYCGAIGWSIFEAGHELAFGFDTLADAVDCACQALTRN